VVACCANDNRLDHSMYMNCFCQFFDLFLVKNRSRLKFICAYFFNRQFHNILCRFICCLHRFFFISTSEETGKRTLHPQAPPFKSSLVHYSLCVTKIPLLMNVPRETLESI